MYVKNDIGIEIIKMSFDLNDAFYTETDLNNPGVLFYYYFSWNFSSYKRFNFLISSLNGVIKKQQISK